MMGTAPLAPAAVPADLPPDSPPLLTILIDTEEAFDWTRPLSPANRTVPDMGAQERAQAIFGRHGATPVYLVDHPVAADDAAAAWLAEQARAGRCAIGAHLHPWVNPPGDAHGDAPDPVPPTLSHAGNLPPTMERAKLVALTDRIAASIGVRPTIYRAGRYGIGPATAGILTELGYEVECSIVPLVSFRADGGPDFRRFGHRPFWFDGSYRLLELPLTAGFTGLLAPFGARIFPAIRSGLGERLRLGGLLARTGLLDRIRLSPEGIGLADHRRLTLALLDQGVRTFSLTYHSPSLVPGCTPYVPDEEALQRFLADIDGYLAFFRDIGGRFVTPGQVRALALAARDRRCPP